MTQTLTQAPKRFSELGIKAESSKFVGNKIELYKVLNCEIVIHYFEVKDSKFTKENASGNCLYLQIEYNGEKRVLFTGSSVLMEMIKKVPADGFPFVTNIVKDNGRYLFT